MLPIGDLNPTRRTAFVTIAVIVACVVIYFGFQIRQGTEVVQTGAGPVALASETAFTLRWAAVPCEVTTGDALSLREIVATYDEGDVTACERDRSADPVFLQDKNVYVALVVSIFMHGGLAHLGFNMLFLWIFGNNIEDRLGSLRYLVFYLGGGIVATAAHVAVQPSSTVPLVGASGAIAAVMGAYLVWFPNAPVRTLLFLFIPTLVRAKWFLGIWFVLQFFTDASSGVAWVAHVGGFVFGVVVGLAMRTNPATAQRVYRPGDLR